MSMYADISGTEWFSLRNNNSLKKQKCFDYSAAFVTMTTYIFKNTALNLKIIEIKFLKKESLSCCQYIKCNEIKIV